MDYDITMLYQMANFIKTYTKLHGTPPAIDKITKCSIPIRGVPMSIETANAYLDEVKRLSLISDGSDDKSIKKKKSKPIRSNKGIHHSAPRVYHQMAISVPRINTTPGRKRKSAREYHKAADQNQLKWIGKEGIGVNDKTWWQCNQGHIFRKAYTDIIKRKKTVCPECRKLNRLEKGRAKKGNRKQLKTGQNIQPSKILAIGYHELAEKIGARWVAKKLPKNTKTKTDWVCKNGHKWHTSYNRIAYKKFGCPKCLDMVNGVAVSTPQRKLRKMTGGELNYKLDRYVVDIALKQQKIAIEYDAWFWHAGSQESDKQRDVELKRVGWKVLRVKSNDLLPNPNSVNLAISLLAKTQIDYIEIVLGDWGKGKTKDDVFSSP